MDAFAETEFAFERADFERVRRLIRHRAGIDLHAGKSAMVYSRLARRLRETGDPSFAAYLGRLEGGGDGAAEWQEFVNCLTTNLTSFFREPHHFELLAEALSPRRGEPVRLWCNAASTGEEPWSIAITALETLGEGGPWRLLATDIDTRVLDTAGRGVYPLPARDAAAAPAHRPPRPHPDDADRPPARGLDDARLRRFFLRGTGANAGSMRVGPALRQRVAFAPFNLTDATWAGLGEPFDIVFCRNVMIYFDAATQRAVLERMHAAMRPGGLLFAGHSENFADSRDLFVPRGRTVYARA